ncbi:hypothetical protein ADEAN_000182500 [Angomonas deanei]|uniref:Uncharacterized protein n=1 Tax=Angomonas deanei TaxID=59799 RepID=A0A7G2C3W1_9TRYP|nr:hypothetical protein ADEAN_000182500 [Angomonas deanei]
MSFRRDPCSPKVSPTYEGFLKDLKQSTNDTEKGGKKKKPSLHSNSEITSLNINNTANSVPRTDNKTRREASKRNSSTSVSTVHHTREDGAEGGSVANPNGGDTSGNNPNPGSDAVTVNTLTEADLLYYRTSYDCRALLGNITLAENADLRLKYFSHVGQCAEKDVEEYVKRKAALAGEGQNSQNDNSNHNNNNTANSGKKIRVV